MLKITIQCKISETGPLWNLILKKYVQSQVSKKDGKDITENVHGNRLTYFKGSTISYHHMWFL